MTDYGVFPSQTTWFPVSLMARRYIDQDFYEDDYVETLPGPARHVYAYLIISCSKACGIIERSTQKVARQMDYSEEQVEAALGRLESDRKIFRHQRFILLRNYVRRNWNPSPTSISKMREELRQIWHITPIREGWVEANQGFTMPHPYPIDAPSMPHNTHSLTHSLKEVEVEVEVASPTLLPRAQDSKLARPLAHAPSREDTKLAHAPSRAGLLKTVRAVTFTDSPLRDRGAFDQAFASLEEPERTFWFEEAWRLADTKGYTSRNWAATIAEWRAEPNNRYTRHKNSRKRKGLPSAREVLKVLEEYRDRLVGAHEPGNYWEEVMQRKFGCSYEEAVAVLEDKPQ